MNSLNKMEEEKMREAFESDLKRRSPYARFDRTNAGESSCDRYWDGAVEAAWQTWQAAIAHANSKHSAILEDYDRLAKLCKKQAGEIEALQYRLQGEFDRGMEAARKEIQTVEVGENSPDSLEDWIGDKPVMRIQFFADSGDMSVGIWPSSGWEVSADQNGTVLEELLSSLSAANTTIAMLADILNTSFLDCEDGTFCIAGADLEKLRDNSAESVVIWERKKLEPLQKQVAMLNQILREARFSVINPTWASSCLIKRIDDVTEHTQAAAEFYDREHAAKVRNDCIQEIEMLRIAHDPRLAVPGDEYYAKAISTLRASANRKDE